MEEGKHKLIQEQPPVARTSRPLLIVVSAPSGCGKSTLCDRLVEEFPKIAYSVSCTTRAPRGEEQDGVEYYFLSKKEFKERIKHGEFLEWAKVHGNYYGTLEDTVLYSMEEGRHILLDIDVQGAAQLRKSLQKLDPRHPVRRGFTDIFVLPPSLEELEKRLRGRGTDEEKVIQKRLEAAEDEMAYAKNYTHRIINDDLETAYDDLKSIILTGMGLF
ncbi:guanylate kinase [Pontiella agarivorans]|uniref:Guanylate kinase n=1 Tax=Pontiella agarivorans TaxID=3038953 RepID=A0ABU5MW50_9BACT|nr:guanylate kinase [Pontiella agarivorans]MDZ8118348.1 guanylate kinase [Pontiella agarivorans]